MQTPYRSQTHSQTIVAGALLPQAIASSLLSAATLIYPPTTSLALSESPVARSIVISRTPSQSLVTVDKDHYAFTMTLPQSSSRFAKLSFSLTHLDRGNSVVPLPLDLKRTVAHIGTINAAEAAISAKRNPDGIAIKQGFIDETGTLWVEFSSPLPAETTLTVIFNGQKPLLAGRYAYSIAAYPNSHSSAAFVGDGSFVAP